MTKEAKRLKNFLRKHKCLNKFKRNAINGWGATMHWYLNATNGWVTTGHLYLTGAKSPSIPDAFSWYDSREGSEYWEKLDDMYRKSKQQEERSRKRVQPYRVKGLTWAKKDEPVREGWKLDRTLKP